MGNPTPKPKRKHKIVVEILFDDPILETEATKIARHCLGHLPKQTFIHRGFIITATKAFGRVLAKI